MQFGRIRAIDVNLLMADVSSLSEFADEVDGPVGVDMFRGSKRHIGWVFRLDNRKRDAKRSGIIQSPMFWRLYY